MKIIDLFSEKKVYSIRGRILSKESSSKYTVLDRKNRKYLVESTAEYFVGQTVLIKDGIILKKVKENKNTTHFVV